MDSSDKKIRYMHKKEGLCEEIYENAESVECVAEDTGDGSVIIIRHDDSRSNTVIEGVEELFGVEDIKTV